MSFSGTAEENDKNSDSIRPFDRQFKEVYRLNESGMLDTALRVSVIFCRPTAGKCVLFVTATAGNAKRDQTFPLVTFGWLASL